MTIGNGLNSALGFGAIALVSRSLGPAQFGLFSLAFGVYMSASKLCDLGLNFGMSRYVAQNSSGNWFPYAKYGLTLKIILTIFVSVLGFLLSPVLATSVFHDSKLIILLRLSFLALIGVAAYDFYTSLTQSLGKFIHSIWVQTAASITKIVLLGALLIFGNTLINSFLIYLLAPLIGAVVGFLLTSKGYLTTKITAEEKQKTLHFSAWMGIGVLIAAVAGNLDIFMVGNKLSSYDVGIYSAASRLSSLITIFSSSLGIVLGVRASSFSENSHLYKYFKKTILLSLLLFIAVLIIWPVSGLIITLTIGEAFVGSVAIFKILLLSAAVLIMRTTLTSNFLGFNKPQYFGISAVLSLGVLLLGNIYLIPRLGAIGAAYSNLASNIFLLLFSIGFLRLIVKKN